MNARLETRRIAAWLGRAATAAMAMAMAFVPVPTHVPSFTPLPAAASSSNQCWQPKEWEQGFLRKTNEARADANLGTLSMDPELSKVARLHTREMTSKDLLYHTNEHDMIHRVTGWSTLGENVGVGGTVDSLQEAFMNSPPHRHNILYPSYQHIGIGVKEDLGRMWVTVIFESHNDPGTPLRMPRC